MDELITSLRLGLASGYKSSVMKKIFLLATPLMIFIFISCRKDYQVDKIEYSKNEKINNANGSENSDHIKIAVVSDIHYLDPSLLQNNAETGTAFQNTVAEEPNKAVLQYSSAIFSKVIAELLYEKPDIVLVTGDLAQAGERVNHQAVASFLEQLRNNGSKVYVTIGNHDINDPKPKGYNGNTSFPLPNVTPSEFTSIYSNFGYGAALSRDPNSLSYVAQPYPGIWILAIDDAKYSPTYSRSGRIKPETMQWIKQQMAIAKQSSATVFGMMHHNLIEHFLGQAGLGQTQPSPTPGTVVDEWRVRADSLMSWGLNLVFTGHSHATDITMRTTNGKTLYDIETGSLVTPPSRYRLIILKNKELDISTTQIKSIDTELPGNQNFTDYSQQALSVSLDQFFRNYLRQFPFSLDSTQAISVAPMASNAWMAHMAGDENISPLEQAKIDSLKNVTPVPEFSIWAFTTLWTDLGVKDSKWHIKLTDL
jgi:predicted phosphodiesterase